MACDRPTAQALKQHWASDNWRERQVGGLGLRKTQEGVVRWKTTDNDERCRNLSSISVWWVSERARLTAIGGRDILPSACTVLPATNLGSRGRDIDQDRMTSYGSMYGCSHKHPKGDFPIYHKMERKPGVFQDKPLSGQIELRMKTSCQIGSLVLAALVAATPFNCPPVATATFNLENRYPILVSSAALVTSAPKAGRNATDDSGNSMTFSCTAIICLSHLLQRLVAPLR